MEKLAMPFLSLKKTRAQTLLRTAQSSCLSLILITAPLAASTCLVTSPAPLFAAPAPFPKPIPPWMQRIIDSLIKNGTLTNKEILVLKMQAGGSYQKLVAIVARIDSQVPNFDINVLVPQGIQKGAVFELQIVVFDRDGNVVEVCDLGQGTYDKP
jgi:hypothetical protein